VCAQPTPTVPVVKPAVLRSPKGTALAPRLAIAAVVVPEPTSLPTWTFTNLSGSYQISASTNLTAWWPVAIVYDTTSITLRSATVARYDQLFYRIQPYTAP
jgi:hypothetical protein